MTASLLRRGRPRRRPLAAAGAQVGTAGGENSSDVLEAPGDAAPLKVDPEEQPQGPKEPISLGNYKTSDSNVTGVSAAPVPGAQLLTAGAPSAPSPLDDSSEADSAQGTPTRNDGSEHGCALCPSCKAIGCTAALRGCSFHCVLA